MIRDISAQDQRIEPPKKDRKASPITGSALFVVGAAAAAPRSLESFSADSSAGSSPSSFATVKRGTAVRDIDALVDQTSAQGEFARCRPAFDDGAASAMDVEKVKSMLDKCKIAPAPAQLGLAANNDHKDVVPVQRGAFIDETDGVVSGADGFGDAKRAAIAR